MPPSARADDVPDGLLLVDKPAGISSHAVVQRVRRQFGRHAKAGHAGTLDPFATGLMLVLLGRGTRIAQFLVGLDKAYETVAQLGARSTTGDPEGEITWTGSVPQSPLALPTGEIRQRPPAYSAVRVDGERAYRRARRGEEVLVPERTVRVDDFRELSRSGDTVRLVLRCSSGTYVRSLVSDLGDAYCLELRRTAVGAFDVGASSPLDALASPASIRARVLDLTQALGHLPHLAPGPSLAADIAHGRKPPVAALRPGVLPPGQDVLVVDDAGAVAVARSDGTVIRTVVGFRA